MMTRILMAWLMGAIVLQYAFAAEESRSVTVERVRPNKILYEPGETATALVTLANKTNTDQSVSLHCSLKWELTKALSLGEQAVTVPAGKKVEAPVKWRIGDYRFGVELSVEAVKDAALLSRGTEVFQVCAPSEVNRVGFHGGWPGPPGYTQIVQNTPDCLDRAIPFGADLMRDTYCNIAEFFGWTPEDFHFLTPTTEEWFDGAGQYHWTRTGTVRTLKELHDRGIKVVFYVWGNGASGKLGREILRAHPEWAARRADGSLFSNFDVGFMDNWDKMTINDRPQHFTQFNLDMFDPSASRYHAEGVVDVTRSLGFDGFRYDAAVSLDWPKEVVNYRGGPLGRGQDEEAISARNVGIVYDIVHKAFPNFIFQHNITFPGGAFRKMDRYYIEWAKRGCAMMSEVPREDFDATNPFHKWAALRDHITEQADAARRYGGNCYIFPSSPWMIAPLDIVYHDVLIHAGGAHLWFMLWDSSDKRFPEHLAAVKPYRRFATRYSALLWDRKLDRVAEPAGLLQVRAPGEVWWNQYVYRRAVNARHVQYIVHLVNPPPGPTVGMQGLQPSAPQKDLKVTLNLPAGLKCEQVSLLNPELGLEPARLEASTEGTKVSVSVASLQVWKVLVFDCRT